jgi:subtilisin family serine protease
MKKSLFAAVALFVMISQVSAQESSKGLAKLSPRTQVYLQTIAKSDVKDKVLPDYIYKKTANGIYMSALIKVTKDIVSSDLEQIGVHVGTRAGSVWTALIPIANVEAFTKIKGISYIELDEPVCLKLDSVRKTTRVDSVQKGINLPHAYTGKGVVVGVVDVGFDYTHPTFFDTSGSHYRISRVWEEKTVGFPPAGFAYGNELTDSFAIQAEQTDNSANTHGTHVVGIAAGSGFGSDSNSRYRGMAYESEIVLVGIMPDSSQWQNTGMSDFIDGINYIFTYAASVNKPAVINLSWGTPVGPRDGHSLFSEACDALTGPGRIFVCAGGNEGDADIHLKKVFTPTDTVVSTFATFDPSLNVKKVWIDMWGDTAKSFCLNVGLWHGGSIASTGYVCLDNNLHSFNLIGTNHDTCFVNIVTSTSEFNGKPRIYLTLYSRVGDSVYLSVKANDGHINIWDGYVTQGEGYGGPLTSYGYPWATQGDSLYTTSDIVATSSTISAGAYSAKTQFTNIYNVAYNFFAYTSLGQLVPFSSRGPTADERVKPDITAPGLCVVSSVSSFDADYRPGGSGFSDVVSSYTDPNQGTKFYFAQFSGTSMATPCTSGIIALMLEANPNLTPTQVRNILAQTAILDTFTGVLPQQGLNTWGHGKINAYQAVIAAALSTGVGTIPGNTIDCRVYPNPNNGKFTLSYSDDKSETLTVEAYNITGQQVYNDEWKTNSGSNSKNIDLSKCNSGMYLLKVSSTRGQSMIKMSVGD